MTNSKSTKKALFMSMLSLLLCFTMLMGATFAWFTDTVTSSNNRIQAGNLKVDLVMYKPEGTEGAGYYSIADGTGDIFSEAAGNGINWEPGKTEIVYLGVRNNGSLALKYNIILNITDGNFEITGAPGLIGSLEFAVVENVKQGALNAGNWEEVKAAANGATGDLPAGKVVAVQEKELDAIATDPTAVDETDYVAIAVHMKEEATNEYQNGAITIDLTVNATQKDAELDSFDSTYDKDAEIPEKNSVTVSGNSTNPTTLNVGDVSVSVPVGSEAGNYSLDVTKEAVTETTEGTVAEYDISLYKDDVKVSGNTEFPVTIDIGKFHVLKNLKHNGNEITDYTYDAFTGIVTFKTTSFSPFEVVYEDVTIDEPETENKQITAGTFTVNPKVFDPALAEENSEYIAINYTVNGETQYVVNDRATTVVVAASSESYEAENDNYTITVGAGKLYSVISGLQNNAHSTVYLLPGTYNEATAINVYSNMDIIGLGNAEDVKVVKVKGSYSNRHLFNCNGAVTRDEHIQVTIRNMYLNASAKNLNSAGKFYFTDNAAVQAIRLSKVKCYDLIIEKSSGYPFYVNGKYDTRGTYMYVENCSTTTTSVVDTASTYKFYHNNLILKDGSKYKESSEITMYPDDWEW